MTLRGTIVFLAGVLAALGAGWAGFPRVINRTQPQPVAFSHQVHADKASSKCDDCHSFRPDGSFTGIPTRDKCDACHAAPMGATAAEKNFIDRYVTPQREPEWLVYARQPENVYFSHSTHVKRGNLKCERCHADHGTTGTLRPHQEDRISGYSRDIWGGNGRPAMTMDGCVACHRQEHREYSCLDCHK
jgi:menaquinone reductase, multiheme cytochrome c subunit